MELAFVSMLQTRTWTHCTGGVADQNLDSPHQRCCRPEPELTAPVMCRPEPGLTAPVDNASNHRLLYKWTVHGWLVLKCQHHNRHQHHTEFKGTVPEVIIYLLIFLIVFKNCYVIENNVWKFQVSTIKIGHNYDSALR